ncbi:MAG: DUF1003 domain-containing protein [Desulfobacteraceae bacterium]|nr:MAG: DUF1003 domain-containing protein [Desulfobacteraceae bacterium]
MKITRLTNSACQVCGKRPPVVELVRAQLVRPVLINIIKQSHPGWSDEGFICTDDLNHFRYEYVRSLVETEKKDLSDLEKEVLESISRQEILSEYVDKEFESRLTIGQRLSDRMAQFGGSWTFIILFACVLMSWIVVNSVAVLSKPFDPYPYIFLNLVLSCLAAIQAPIIMMSQNRQEAKDRVRATHDYQVNLKAELEIRQLHQKLDHLLSNQWERLVEIQEVQLELLSEMRSHGMNSGGDEREVPPDR